jgi:predicted RNase H-like nuclease (RuvC/YqgF family)
MSGSDALEEVTSRLARALDEIEKTVAERRQSDLKAGTLEEQVQTLTANLGAERERSERLAAASEEVSDRLDTAINSVRTILGTPN